MCNIYKVIFGVTWIYLIYIYIYIYIYVVVQQIEGQMTYKISNHHFPN